MLTTDVEMASILHMERSTRDTQGPDRGQQIFYVRSFCVTAKVLKGVIEAWEAKAMVSHATKDIILPPFRPASSETALSALSSRVYMLRSPFWVLESFIVQRVKLIKSQLYDEIVAWQSQLERLEDSSQVFVRYVGTSSTVSAFSRFTADLKGRTDGVYAAFIETLLEIDPAAIENCACFSFPSGLTAAFRTPDGSLHPMDSTTTDIKEQALI